jgi:hypothetical protein
MLRVRIPAEINDYKEKVVFGLTVRQVISIVAALLVGVPIGVFGGRVLPADVVGWCVILAVAPVIAWGFAVYNGMRFEVFVRVLFNYFALPQRRVYEDVDVNYLCIVNAEIRESRILRERAEYGENEENGEVEDGDGDE